MLSNGWHCFDLVYVESGKAYMLDEDLRSINMGSADAVVNCLTNGGQMPDIDATRRLLLISVKKMIDEEKFNGSTAGLNENKPVSPKRFKRPGSKRVRPTANAKYKPVNIRHLTQRKRLPGH